MPTNFCISSLSLLLAFEDVMRVKIDFNVKAGVISIIVSRLLSHLSELKPNKGITVLIYFAVEMLV